MWIQSEYICGNAVTYLICQIVAICQDQTDLYCKVEQLHSGNIHIHITCLLTHDGAGAVAEKMLVNSVRTGPI